MSVAIRGLPAGGGEAQHQVAGLSINVARCGSGTPVVHLHDSLGLFGWLPLHDRLAERYDTLAPDLPGYALSQRPTWARHPRDLAVVMGLLCDALRLDRPVVLGVGLGGWIAAELATMRPRQLGGLVLVNPVGLKPRDGRGEIADQMLRGPLRYGLGGFRDADSFRRLFAIDSSEVDDVPDALYTLWDHSTEMTARIVWKPWMFSLELPYLLGAVDVPTAVVCSDADGLVPIDVGHQYAELLPDATFLTVPGAGHWLELEEPDAVAAAVDTITRRMK